MFQVTFPFLKENKKNKAVCTSTQFWVLIHKCTQWTIQTTWQWQSRDGCAHVPCFSLHYASRVQELQECLDCCVIQTSPLWIASKWSYYYFAIMNYYLAHAIIIILLFVFILVIMLPPPPSSKLQLSSWDCFQIQLDVWASLQSKYCQFGWHGNPENMRRCWILVGREGDRVGSWVSLPPSHHLSPINLWTASIVSSGSAQ